MMGRALKRILLAAVVLAVLVVGGVSIAAATGSGDDSRDKAITGAALDRATAVALKHTGGGRVTGTELGDEEGYYEVEVTREDGHSVDVHLDRNFQVIRGRTDGGEDSRDGGSNEN